MRGLKPNVGQSKGCDILSQVNGYLRMARRASRSVGLGAVLMLAAMGAPTACSDSGNGGAGGAGGSGVSGGAGGGSTVDARVDPETSTGCAVITDVDTYVANLTKIGRNGVLSFQVIQSDPAPPAEGSNVWKVRVLGGDGMPIADDELGVEVFMPGHEHNTPIPPIVSYDGATKTFAVNPVHFSMGGRWRITLSVMDPSDPTIPLDSAQFFFCVD
jgi:hypothetical protein